MSSQQELDKGYITADIHTFLVVLYVYLETLHLQGVLPIKRKTDKLSSHKHTEKGRERAATCVNWLACKSSISSSLKVDSALHYDAESQ